MVGKRVCGNVAGLGEMVSYREEFTLLPPAIIRLVEHCFKVKWTILLRVQFVLKCLGIFFHNEQPTLDKLLRDANSDPDLDPDIKFSYSFIR